MLLYDFGARMAVNGTVVMDAIIDTPTLVRSGVVGASDQPLIDGLLAQIAVVDHGGEIVAVNRAWREFALANGGSPDKFGIGCNYLEILAAVVACGDDASADQDLAYATLAAAGLRAVLDGRNPRFRMEYPCDTATERRWFMLTITPVAAPQGLGAIVAHEELTALRLARDENLRHAAQLNKAFTDMVEAVALFVEKRDPYTAGHQQQVSALCDVIGQGMGLDEDRRQGLVLGASIHDIGKISVPAEILTRPGRLSDPEMAIIRTHPETGFEILHGICFPWPLADMIRQHHERLDGSGYPFGLTGDAICLEARIIAVADVFDAISSHRPYRPAHGHEAALAELSAGRGSRYDASVVDAFMASWQAGRLPV
ncbi:HD domain-containing protein [Nitrogeniibacter mangrovi]|uniref:HD domain-containing protein n=1 Tax=Nitrogeniibacter mangrovi TaxID=2016596 RepID=A0A6C1AYA1_9RHOO|nr:HD domain-containing phosphohydrolase [Nitrogeniibacter mangrovi]QID16326.1 HD domain-containing protein [Nitrogeniibacter mangrovi]